MSAGGHRQALRARQALVRIRGAGRHDHLVLPGARYEGRDVDPTEVFRKRARLPPVSEKPMGTGLKEQRGGRMRPVVALALLVPQPMRVLTPCAAASGWPCRLHQAMKAALKIPPG